MSVCTIGDLLVDVIVRIDGPIAPDTDTFSAIEITAGGQAANVAAWVASLGHRARLICMRLKDPPGLLLETELERRGVENVGPIGEGRTGTVVSLARADGTRTMLTDRGDGTAFETSAFDKAWLDQFDWLHISGYTLADEPFRATALAAASAAYAAGCRVSVDLASTRVIEQIGSAAFDGLLRQLRPSVVFATEAELAGIGSARSTRQASSATWITKHGAAGCTIEQGTKTESFAARPASTVDPTGAGDAFAAGFLCGGIETALTTAARCVAQNGAMP